MNFDDAAAREAAHFLPVVKRHPVALVEGRGSRVRDLAGREYIDLMAGWGVTCIGHSHPALVEAIRDQAGRLMQTTNVFYTLPQTRAARAAGRASRPTSITRASSPTRAPRRSRARSSWRTAPPDARSSSPRTASFHGRTLGALHVIGTEKHRAPYAPLLHESVRVPFDDLDAARARDRRSTAAFIVEPMQGEGGVNVPREGYLRGLASCATRPARC